MSQTTLTIKGLYGCSSNLENMASTELVAEEISDVGEKPGDETIIMMDGQVIHFDDISAGHCYVPEGQCCAMCGGQVARQKNLAVQWCCFVQETTMKLCQECSRKYLPAEFWPWPELDEEARVNEEFMYHPKNGEQGFAVGKVCLACRGTGNEALHSLVPAVCSNCDGSGMYKTYFDITKLLAKLGIKISYGDLYSVAYGLAVQKEKNKLSEEGLINVQSVA